MEEEKNVKVGDYVWFMPDESRILCGCVTEVLKNIVHVNVKVEGHFDADEYAIRKDNIATSRQEILKSYDDAIDRIKKGWENIGRMCHD